MSKTVSSRLPNKRHDELRQRCNELGCTMNEFIENSIYLAMDNAVDFNFELDEPEQEEKESEIKEESSKSESKSINKRKSDPQEIIIKEIPELKKPTVEIIYD